MEPLAALEGEIADDAGDHHPVLAQAGSRHEGAARTGRAGRLAGFGAHLVVSAGQAGRAAQELPALAGLFHARFPSVEPRSEEHTSELQSLMRISYAVFCLKKKT